jgi:hypothetical protein
VTEPQAEPQTDAERVEWLWNRLDVLNGENASLKAALASAERDALAARADADAARDQLGQLAAELSGMAVALNEARQAAATAVREHIAASRG